MINLCMVAYNRPRLTEQALETIGIFDNLTILDDHSDTETATLLRDFAADRDNVCLIRNEDKIWGTGDARNRCIAKSRERFGEGELLCLTDNDVCFKFVSWMNILAACYRGAEQEGFQVIGAYNHPFHHPIARVKLGTGVDVKEVVALSSQSMMMDWRVWNTYGPFCRTEPTKGCQSEDIDFTNKIRKDGGRLGVVDPPLLVNTGITNSAGEKIPGWELVKAECPEGVYCE